MGEQCRTTFDQMNELDQHAHASAAKACEETVAAGIHADDNDFDGEQQLVYGGTSSGDEEASHTDNDVVVCADEKSASEKQPHEVKHSKEISVAEIPQGFVRITWHSPEGSFDETGKMGIFSNFMFINGSKRRLMRDMNGPPVMGSAGQAILKFGPLDWCEIRSDG